MTRTRGGKVLVVQELLAQYRIEFYVQLRDALQANGITLALVHGHATGGRAALGDEASLPWARTVRNRSIGPMVWQDVGALAANADLVIVEHANRHLANYLLLLRRRLGGAAIAFWGHGANLQSRNRDSLRERFKRTSATWPDWWFAYTEGSAERVVAAGFDRRHITVVQNAIDTTPYRSLTSEDRLEGRCVYAGGLHEHKRIPFLMEAARIAAESQQPFHLDVLGDGPLRELVVAESAENPAVTYHGTTFGEEKARVVSRAQVMLMPGLVGLGVLDAFAARVPLITTAQPYHSPEIEYLRDGVNGRILRRESSAQEYADEFLALLADPDQLKALREGCAAASSTYSIESMVARFADGIQGALASRRSTG